MGKSYLSTSGMPNPLMSLKIMLKIGRGLAARVDDVEKLYHNWDSCEGVFFMKGIWG